MNLTDLIQISQGFRTAKVLMTAVEFGVFSILNGRSLTLKEICDKLKLNPRSACYFLDTLVALRLLERSTDNDIKYYGNTDISNTFLNKHGQSYIGDILELMGKYHYHYWGQLGLSLQSGTRYHDELNLGKTAFGKIYSDSTILARFAAALSLLSRDAFLKLAELQEFEKYQTVCDVGGGDGELCCCLASQHPHIKCTTFDLPAMAVVAQHKINDMDLAKRIRVVSGDFIRDPLPPCDVVVMSMVLYDRNLDQKKQLLNSAYSSLFPGGALIVVDNFIDDDHSKNLFALLESLNMLIEYGNPSVCIASELCKWCKEVGFEMCRTEVLTETTQALIAYKGYPGRFK